MKTQMKFQKILSLVTLVIAALTFVYAVCYFSTGLSEMSMYTTKQQGSDMINADKLYDFAQTTNDLFLALSIVFILLAVSLYVTASNKRRNYYITNYISVGAVIAFAAVFAILGIALVTICLNMYVNDIDWEMYRAYYEMTTSAGNKIYPYYSDSKIVFILGYILYAVVLLCSAANLYNLIWKIKLMKGEKALLENGLAKEVA